MGLFAEVVLHPAFAPADFDRLKGQTVAGIASAKQDPSSTAKRILPTLLFGPDSSYGPPTPEGAVQSNGRQGVEAFQPRWFHPTHATLGVTRHTHLGALPPHTPGGFPRLDTGTVPGFRGASRECKWWPYV